MPGTVSNAFSVSSPLDLGSDLCIQAFLFPADHMGIYFFSSLECFFWSFKQEKIYFFGEERRSPLEALAIGHCSGACCRTVIPSEYRGERGPWRHRPCWGHSLGVEVPGPGTPACFPSSWVGSTDCEKISRLAPSGVPGPGSMVNPIMFYSWFPSSQERVVQLSMGC